jgi:hypothetical protein
MSCTSRLTWFDHSNNIRWRVQIMYFIYHLLQFSLASCHFLCLGSKFSPQHQPGHEINYSPPSSAKDKNDLYYMPSWHGQGNICLYCITAMASMWSSTAFYQPELKYGHQFYNIRRFKVSCAHMFNSCPQIKLWQAPYARRYPGLRVMAEICLTANKVVSLTASRSGICVSLKFQ